MSPALNGSSAIWWVEGSDVIEIRNGITFDFYMELPHLLSNRPLSEHSATMVSRHIGGQGTYMKLSEKFSEKCQ